MSIGKGFSGRSKNCRGTGIAVEKKKHEKTAVGTTHLPACPWEKFRLNSTAGSLSHCWVPVLQISCESRFYKPRKSKHFPVHKRKVSRVIKWDKMVSEALSEAPCYISNTSRSKTLSYVKTFIWSIWKYVQMSFYLSKQSKHKQYRNTTRKSFFFLLLVTQKFSLIS